MAFLSVKKEDYTQEFSGGGGKYLRNKSGMYPVTLKHVIVDVTKNGAQMINLVVDYNGNDNTLFGVWCIAKRDGSENPIGVKQLGALAIVCGIEEIDDPTSMPVTIGSKTEERSVMEEFTGCECVLHVKRKYELYNGGVVERIQVMNVFEAETFASAVELVNKADGNEVELGKQYRIEEQYAEQDILADGVTQDMVDAFHAEKRSASSAAKDNKPKSGLGSSGRFGNRG